MSLPTRLLPALALALLPAAAAADEGEGRAFVEAEVLRNPCFAGETVRATLRVGVDEQFFATWAAPLSPRPMDLPVLVRAPWFSALPPDTAAAGPSLALGDDVVAATRTTTVSRDGRPFRVFEFERRFVAGEAGETAFAAPTLRFSWARRFATDAFGRRVPEERREASVAGDAVRLLVLPLPDEGRPAGFGGAVGRFTVTATAEPRSCAVGESLRLVLRVSGDGDLSRVPPPALAPLAGFHVFGRIDAVDGGARVWTWDLAPIDADVKAIPAVEFPTFDPTPPAGWRVLRTDPVPIEVRPAPPGAAVPRPAIDSDGGEDAVRAAPRPWWRGRIGVALLSSLAAAAVGAATVAVLRRTRLGRGSGGRPAGAPARPDATADRAERVVDAAAAFRAASGRADAAATAAALVDFLAATLDVAAPAVIAPDLGARLRAAGVDAATADRAAALVERLVAARYGGAAVDAAAARGEALAVVTAIERTVAPP